MPLVRFTQNIQRHVSCPPRQVEGRTVAEALDAYFQANPRARGYVLDDQGALRQHMVVFLNGRPITDRRRLTDPISPVGSGDGDAAIDVMQALSGG